jgi:hypothetical protein
MSATPMVRLAHAKIAVGEIGTTGVIEAELNAGDVGVLNERGAILTAVFSEPLPIAR